MLIFFRPYKNYYPIMDLKLRSPGIAIANRTPIRDLLASALFATALHRREQIARRLPASIGHTYTGSSEMKKKSLALSRKMADLATT
jgi:hypothetical protein